MMHRTNSSRLARSLMFLVCMLAGWTLYAQVVITSTIVGTVTDPQQAIIPGAQVILSNVDTGVEMKQTSDSAGDYQFSNLIAGHYRISVTMAGFSQAVSTPVALENGTTRRINIAEDRHHAGGRAGVGRGAADGY